ncbi:MAG: hypothetical protein CR997_01705 [Acidobacteria bacterium]|nr:MAG: hypothetical protein CR997_01705 [Acidobacteriota bacterium]
MKKFFLFILICLSAGYALAEKPNPLISHFIENSQANFKEGVLSQATFANQQNTLDLLRTDQLDQITFPVLESDMIFTRDYFQDHGEIKTWRGIDRATNASMLLTVGKAGFFGHIIYQGHQFIIEPGFDFGTSVFAEVDPSQNIPAAKCEAIPDYDQVEQLLATEKPANHVRKAASAEVDCQPGEVIDVMILYTKGFAELRGDNTMARIQNYVDVANESYINSAIDTQLHLVHTLEVDYPDYTPDPSGGDASSIGIALMDLTYLQGNYKPGLFDNIEALRDQYGADQVTLINKVTTGEISGSGITCGLAWLITRNNISSGARISYAVIEDGTICGSDVITYAHEVGHNMGCAHDRNTTQLQDGSGGKFPYSYGYQDPPNQFVTVMAYAHTCPGTCFYINHFSNPEVNYEGAPTGVDHTDPDNSADNARTINETRNLMGQYRTKVRGTLHDYYYVIPEVLFEQGMTTDIHIINTTSTGKADIDLFAFSEDGKQLNPNAVNLSVPSNGKVSFDFSTVFDSLSSQVKWIQVGSPRPLHVFAEFHSNRVRSAFWASDKTSYSAYVPHVAKNTAQFETVVANANATGKIATVQLDPEPFGDVQDLGYSGCSYGKSSGTAVDYFGYDVELVDWALIKSTDQTVAAMEYFSYLPEKEKVASLGLNQNKTNTLRFLHVATDTANFWTGLVYINVSNSTIEATERFFAADGTEIHSETKTLIRGQKVVFIFDQDNTTPEGTAWIEISAANPALVGYELFGSANGSPHQFFSGFQGSMNTGSKLDYPIVVSDNVNWTGIVALNLGDTAGSITFKGRDKNGDIVESYTEENVQPHVKIVKTAESMFSSDKLHDIVWIQADTTASKWSGFVIWGDKTETRHQLSGLGAVVYD